MSGEPQSEGPIGTGPMGVGDGPNEVSEADAQEIGEAAGNPVGDLQQGIEDVYSSASASVQSRGGSYVAAEASPAPSGPHIR